MKQNMGEFDETNGTAYTNTHNNAHAKPTSKSSSSTGDYIDFEEVK